MAVWWSKVDFSFLSTRVYVCLKIMKPKGKQDYVRSITERARECSGIKYKKRAGECVLKLSRKGRMEYRDKSGYTCVDEKNKKRKK